MDKKKILRLLMRVVGVVMLAAFAAAFMPLDWMAAAHAWLGLGELPAAPVVEYLARSASLLYGLLGGLFVLVAGDLERYAPIVRFLGAMFMVLGAVLTGVDVAAGMPLYWTLWEGPPTIAVGLAMVLLSRPQGTEA